MYICMCVCVCVYIYICMYFIYIRNINNMVIPGAIAPILVRYANPSKPKTDMGGGSADWEVANPKP